MSDRRGLAPVEQLVDAFAPEPPDDSPHGPTPPQDLHAEQSVLGAMLRDHRTTLEVTELLNDTHFYAPRHELIYATIRRRMGRLEPVDPGLVGDDLRRTGDLTRVGGPAYLSQLYDQGIAVPTDAALHYADILRDLAGRRRLIEAGTRIAQLGYTPSEQPLTDLHAAAVDALDRDTILTPVPGVDTPHPGQDIDDFLHGDDDPYDWLIPGVLERQDRLIVTAGEGKGKSTLLRQLAVQIAAGIHPFTGEGTPPAKVLLLDLENSRRQSRRKLRPLRLQAGDRLTRGQLVVEIRAAGIDLTSPEDRTWLTALVEHHRPDVLISGPIYKMASGDTDKEKDSKPVALALDALRDRYDMAVILEAHTRKAEDAAGKKRAREPYGWSGWMRWPEFGLHLADDGALTHWRGARDERDFPDALLRGGAWPWSPTTLQQSDFNWIRVERVARACSTKPSYTYIANALGLSKSTVGDAVARHRDEWDRILSNLPGPTS